MQSRPTYKKPSKLLPPSEANKVHIDNIPLKTNPTAFEETITPFLSSFGNVVDLKVLQNWMKKNYLLVTFSSDKPVKELIFSQPSFKDMKLKYKRAKVPKKQPKKSKYLSGVTKLFVGGLPSKVSKREFEEYFKGFGGVRRTILPKKEKDSYENKGHGFVLFRKTDDVRKVLEKGNGHFIRGKRLDVQIAKPRRKNSPNFDAYHSRDTHASSEGEESGRSSLRKSYVDFLFSSDSSRIREVIVGKERVERVRGFNDGGVSDEGDQARGVVSRMETLISRRRSRRT